jgi:hypothetical protein
MSGRSYGNFSKKEYRWNKEISNRGNLHHSAHLRMKKEVSSRLMFGLSDQVALVMSLQKLLSH